MSYELSISKVIYLYERGVAFPVWNSRITLLRKDIDIGHALLGAVKPSKHRIYLLYWTGKLKIIIYWPVFQKVVQFTLLKKFDQ